MTSSLRLSLIEEGAVVKALEQGRQTLMVHQADLFEGERAAGPAEFLLVPFLNREQGQNLLPQAGIFVHQAQAARNAEGQVAVHAYAVTEARFRLTRPFHLPRMEGLHIFRPSYLEAMFKRGAAELLVSAIRVYLLPEGHWVGAPEPPPEYPAWHELADPIDTLGAEPALPDDRFRRQLSAMRAVLKDEIPITEGSGS